jgi:hypothetical protein
VKVDASVAPQTRETQRVVSRGSAVNRQFLDGTRETTFHAQAERHAAVPPPSPTRVLKGGYGRGSLKFALRPLGSHVFPSEVKARSQRDVCLTPTYRFLRPRIRLWELLKPLQQS